MQYYMSAVIINGALIQSPKPLQMGNTGAKQKYWETFALGTPMQSVERKQHQHHSVLRCQMLKSFSIIELSKPPDLPWRWKSREDLSLTIKWGRKMCLCRVAVGLQQCRTEQRETFYLLNRTSLRDIFWIDLAYLNLNIQVEVRDWRNNRSW